MPRKRSVPDRMVNDCLSSCPVRATLGLMVAVMSFLGLVLYPSFSKNLDVGVAPPPDSPSGQAKEAYAKYYDQNPIQIIAHVRTRDGTPLIDDDLAACAVAKASGHLSSTATCPKSERASTRLARELRAGSALGQNRIGEDGDLPRLDEVLQNASNALKAIVADFTDTSQAGKCDKTAFTSYWSLPSYGDVAINGTNISAPDLLRQLFAPSLFANGDAETLMVASVTSCLVEEDGEVVSKMVYPGCTTAKKEECMPINDLSAAMKAFADSSDVDPRLQVSIVSLPDVFAAALEGVDDTMVVSTATAPIAFFILACVLRNARLLIITLVNIVACIFGTTLVMYFVSSRTEVSSQAPALMLACALAMSIDYSLFLLTRFRDELISRRRPLRQAVVTMLETSGHTVLVSGMTLTLCFLGMLLIPVSTIASLGVASAITVLFAIFMALVFTPLLLLAFPAFFADSKRFGCSCSSCYCGWLCTSCGSAAAAAGTAGAGSTNTRREMPKALNDPFLDAGTLTSTDDAASSAAASGSGSRSQQLSADPERTTEVLEAATPNGSSLSQVDVIADAARRARRGCWPTIGASVQRWWVAPLVLLALAGLAVPFVQPLVSSDLTYVEGVAPLLPRGAETTNSFLALQESFGVSHVFPNKILMVPDHPDDLLTREWLDAACSFVDNVAANVTAEMARQGRSCLNPSDRPCMSALDFEGWMIVGGNCTIALYDALEGASIEHNGTTYNVTDEQIESTLGALWSQIDIGQNPDHAATYIRLTTTIDPFGDDGRAWIQAVRNAIDANTVIDGVRLGTIHFTGLPQEQMDGSLDTFAALPLVIGATLAIVCVVLFVAFQSLLVPLRAALCLIWMLVVTFGSALLVYQDGALADLGLGFLAPSGGALFWMSPCISFSIVVGLGLDYDIFLMESVVEYWDHGATPREAVVMALNATGNTICLAGIIMTLAFGALLVGSSAALNQIGYLLIVGVLIDCFVTTKVIIPCAMTLLPYELNFWPRKRPPPGLRTLSLAHSSGIRHVPEDESTWEAAD